MTNSKQVKLKVAKQTKLVAKLNKIDKQAYLDFKDAGINGLGELEVKMFNSQMEHSCAQEILFALEATLEKVIKIETEINSLFSAE